MLGKKSLVFSTMMDRAGNYAETFSNNKFRSNYNKIFRYDRNRSENCLDLHINENISCILLQQHELFLILKLLQLKSKINQKYNHARKMQRGFRSRKRYFKYIYEYLKGFWYYKSWPFNSKIRGELHLSLKIFIFVWVCFSKKKI